MTRFTKGQIAEALKNDQFRLFGQPKWTFGKNTCNTYEVFADLIISDNHQTGTASDFMPVIESDPALTHSFGEWFFRQAFNDGVKLMDDLDMDLIISINLLGEQANEPVFCERLSAMMDEAGLSPENVQFELSEAQQLTEIGLKNLNCLHKTRGISLVLGNFGTGYSNIDLLRQLPFSMIEISKAFTADITTYEDDLKLIVAIQQMAEIMGITVCAKGIETAEQMELLEDAGFFKGQGYLIGRPMSMKDLADYVKKYAA